MRKVLALLFALGLFVPLAACGGGDDEADSSGSGSSSGSASSTDDEETTTTEDEDASGGASGDFCDRVEEIAGSEFGEDFDFNDPDSLNDALDLIEGLAAEAPDELEDDFDTAIEGFEVIIEALIEAGDDPEAQAEAFTELEDDLTDFDEATTNIDDFTLEECGTTIDGETDTDDSSDGEDTSLVDFADDVDACEGGDMAACDTLYTETPFDSEAEAIARECGGEDPGGDHTGDCEEVFG